MMMNRPLEGGAVAASRPGPLTGPHSLTVDRRLGKRL